MTDNELAIFIRAQLLAGLTARGIVDCEVLASQQPTTQGRATGMVVYFFPLTDHHYGWQSRRNSIDPETELMTTTEYQIVESPFQVMALSPQDPENLSLLTAKDLATTAKMIVNSQAFIRALKAVDNRFGVQRVSDVRNPYFVNDRAQFEASPSFDFTVSHVREFTGDTPTITTFEFDQGRV